MKRSLVTPTDFLTFRLPPLNDWWCRPFNFGTTAGSFPPAHPFSHLLALLTLWEITVLNEEDFDGPITNVLDVVVVSWM